MKIYQPSKLPHTSKGARVMYLNNKLFEHGICNGSIGIITKITNDEVTFSMTDNITKINIYHTSTSIAFQHHTNNSQSKVSLP